MEMREAMNVFSKLTMIAGVALATSIACNKPKEVTPARQGDRGDNCQAKNDCKSGLSCISSTCQPVAYDFKPSGKECLRFECEDIKDCCGDKPTDLPEKCVGKESVCNQPSVAECPGYVTCSDDSECGEGQCDKATSQTCSVTLGTCTSDENCYAETCEISEVSDGYGGLYQVGTCTLSSGSCDADEDCLYFGDVCGDEEEAATGYCDCANPEYDPTADICSDTDCEEVCGLVCTDNLCIEDDSCEKDEECPGDTPFCDDGECVECTDDDECDEEIEEECRAGSCERPCQFDQECPDLNACESGACVYVGCTTNADCLFALARSDSDARQAECVQEEGIGHCRFPCDNDAQCFETEICDSGLCTDIGCQTDAQCDSLLGLQGQEISESRPYVTQGRCVAPEATEED